MLKGTDCRLEETAHRRPAARGSLAAVAAGGAAIFTEYGGDPAVTRYWHLDPVSGVATELTPPEDAKYWKLTLSRDGQAVGWIESQRSGITDVAVSPDGALIAISTSTNLNIGDVRDSPLVLRTRDGAEVYRRFFRRYTRTRMAFLGARHLAVTRVDLDRGGGWIEVLRVPEAAAGQ